MANWTPDSFIGELFNTLGKFVSPPTGVESPSMWGTPAYLQTLFPSATAIETTSRHFNLRYHSAEHWLDMWRAVYGPLQRAFASLSSEQQDLLHRDLIDLVHRHNTSQQGTMVVPSEYLEVIVWC